MLMGFEIQDVEKQDAGLAPQDMSGIFSVLCALDNRVTAAQKARGYSETETLRALGQRSLEQKRRYGCIRRLSSNINIDVRETLRSQPLYFRSRVPVYNL